MSSLPSNPDQIGGPGPGEHHLLQRILGRSAQPSVSHFFFFRNRWAKKRGKKTTRCRYSVIIKLNVSTLVYHYILYTIITIYHYDSNHQISISFQQWCFNPHSMFNDIWDENTSKVRTGNSHRITQLYMEHAKSEWV